jgi:hemerythrin-like domain-containing protein
MKATEILKLEHDIILERLNYLAIDLQHSLRYRIDNIQKGIDFILDFVDKFHHTKEEEIYFKWMGEKDADTLEGPVKCMYSEHDMGREWVDSAQKALNELAKGNSSAEKVVKENLRLFIAMIREHIEKENTLIYGIADKLNEEHKDGDAFMLPLFDKVALELKTISQKYS